MDRNYKRELEYALVKIQLLTANEIQLQVKLEEKEQIIKELNDQLKTQPLES